MPRIPFTHNVTDPGAGPQTPRAPGYRTPSLSNIGATIGGFDKSVNKIAGTIKTNIKERDVERAKVELLSAASEMDNVAWEASHNISKTKNTDKVTGYVDEAKAKIKTWMTTKTEHGTDRFTDKETEAEATRRYQTWSTKLDHIGILANDRIDREDLVSRLDQSIDSSSKRAVSMWDNPNMEQFYTDNLKPQYDMMVKQGMVTQTEANGMFEEKKHKLDYERARQAVIALNSPTGREGMTKKDFDSSAAYTSAVIDGYKNLSEAEKEKLHIDIDGINLNFQSRLTARQKQTVDKLNADILVFGENPQNGESDALRISIDDAVADGTLSETQGERYRIAIHNSIYHQHQEENAAKKDALMANVEIYVNDPLRTASDGKPDITKTDGQVAPEVLGETTEQIKARDDARENAREATRIKNKTSIEAKAKQARQDGIITEKEYQHILSDIGEGAVKASLNLKYNDEVNKKYNSDIGIMIEELEMDMSLGGVGNSPQEIQTRFESKYGTLQDVRQFRANDTDYDVYLTKVTRRAARVFHEKILRKIKDSKDKSDDPRLKPGYQVLDSLTKDGLIHDSLGQYPFIKDNSNYIDIQESVLNRDRAGAIKKLQRDLRGIPWTKVDYKQWYDGYLKTHPKASEDECITAINKKVASQAVSRSMFSRTKRNLRGK